MALKDSSDALNAARSLMADLKSSDVAIVCLTPFNQAYKDVKPLALGRKKNRSVTRRVWLSLWKNRTSCTNGIP